MVFNINSNMTTWGLIREMVKRGYEFGCGPHLDFRGYWAAFIPHDFDPNDFGPDPEDNMPTGYFYCDECESVEHDWKVAGHAMTLHRAVIMAAKIALGWLDKPMPTPEEFE